MSVTCQSDGLPKSIVVDHDQEFEDKARYVDVGNSVAVTQPQSSAYLPHSQSSGDVKTSTATEGLKFTPGVKPMDKACSIPSYDSIKDSTSSDSDGSTDTSEESAVPRQNDMGCDGDVNKDRPNTYIPKTKGETFYKDLPPIELCQIPFPENAQLLPIATVSHYTEKLLILSSLPSTPPIDEGTVLWSKDNSCIAKVFETFGPVRRPLYSIRINSFDDLLLIGVTLGDIVYVIPAHPTLTRFVFPQELMKHKGSDASWKDDNEVPLELQDYSDDEDESNTLKNKGKSRKGKMPRPKPESVGISSRGVHRQPSIKYTRDPQMQPYFPMMCNVPSQPLNKNSHVGSLVPCYPSAVHSFDHSPHFAMRPSPFPQPLASTNPQSHLCAPYYHPPNSIFHHNSY